MGLILEFNLNEGAELTDRNTGKELADIRVASFVQFPTHTAVRLDFNAPKTTYILKKTNGKKDLRSNVKGNQP